MSDIKVVRIHAAERQEQTATTGTKAWELFRDDADVIAARGAAVTSRTWPTSSVTVTRSRRWPSTPPTAATSCATRPRT